MKQQRVVNAVMNRELVVDADLYKQHEEFFKGWSFARQPITPRRTFDRVDELKGRENIEMEIGELFGRVSSWQALSFLKAEYKISDRLFATVCKAY